jgi:hypothetical protein
MKDTLHRYVIKGVPLNGVSGMNIGLLAYKGYPKALRRKLFSLFKQDFLFLKRNTGIWVRNVPGTKDERCKCGSWKAHWIKFSGEYWPSQCSVKGCDRTDLVGAHVRKIPLSQDEIYIVPMCNKCNSKTVILILDPKVKIVLAHQEECALNL